MSEVLLRSDLNYVTNYVLHPSCSLSRTFTLWNTGVLFICIPIPLPLKQKFPPIPVFISNSLSGPSATPTCLSSHPDFLIQVWRLSSAVGSCLWRTISQTNSHTNCDRITSAWWHHSWGGLCFLLQHPAPIKFVILKDIFGTRNQTAAKAVGKRVTLR